MRSRKFFAILLLSILGTQWSVAAGASSPRAGEIVFHKQLQRCAIVQQQNSDGSYALKFSPVSDRNFEETHSRYSNIVLDEEFEQIQTQKKCQGNICKGGELIIETPHRWLSPKGMQKWSDKPRWATIHSTFPGGAALVTFQDDHSSRTYCFTARELAAKQGQERTASSAGSKGLR